MKRIDRSEIRWLVCVYVSRESKLQEARKRRERMVSRCFAKNKLCVINLIELSTASIES